MNHEKIAINKSKASFSKKKEIVTSVKLSGEPIRYDNENRYRQREMTITIYDYVTDDEDGKFFLKEKLIIGINYYICCQNASIYEQIREKKSQISKITKGCSSYIYGICTPIPKPQKTAFSRVNLSRSLVKSILPDANRAMELFPKSSHNIKIFNFTIITLKKFACTKSDESVKMHVISDEQIYIDYVPSKFVGRNEYKIVSN